MEKNPKNKSSNKEKKNLKININNNNNILPHKTIFNNLKSIKYFSNTATNSDVMKKALIKYRESNISNNSQNEMTISSTSTGYIPKANKISIKLDKNLYSFEEPKTKTSFQKIAPKILNISKEEKINSIEETEEFKTSKKNKNLNTNNNKRFNKKKFITEVKETKKINIDSTLDYNDSIDFDISNEDDNNINMHKNSLTDRNKNNLNIGINIHDINFNEFIKMENLFNELIKELEINKMNQFEIKLNIVKKFLSIFNDNNNQNLFLSFDINSLNNTNNNQNIFLMIKEYLIQQIIFFYIIILIGLINNEKEKNIYLSGLQNLSFYFHQNFQVFNFILISKVNKNNIKLLENNSVESYEKCLNLVKENKTWLNENNFYKCLQINNKMSKQIIKNLFEQIRIYFSSNPYFDKNDIYKPKINNNKILENKNKVIKKNISQTNTKNNVVKSLSKTKNKIIKNNINTASNKSKNNNQKDFIDSDINLLLEYIKSYKNVKFTSLLKDLNYSPSINFLKEKTKMYDKKLETKKNNKEINSENEKIKINIPYLKNINPKYKYTLVLGLDETLIHYIQNGEYIQIRPGAENFIKELSEFYEIIIFTSSLKSYADLVINGIDKQNKISSRLYREHTMKIGNSNIKDLNKLGRDLKKVIIVDNLPESYCLQPKNGINVIDFDGNENDDMLIYLQKDLIKLVKNHPEDVRPFLKEIQIKLNKRANEIIKMNRKKNNFFNNNNNKTSRNKSLSKSKHNKKTISSINDKIIESINEYDLEDSIKKNRK